MPAPCPRLRPADRARSRIFRVLAVLAVLAGIIQIQPPPANAAPITLNSRVAAGADDAEEFPTGVVSLTSTDLELVLEPGRGNQTVGMRFQGIAVPQGATITSAYVQFQVDEVSTDAASLNIAAEDTDNAATFTTATNNVSARPRTGATVIWTPSAWPTVDVAGPDQRTPNIASLVQAVINRPGWTSGNALAVIVSGSGARVAKAYEGSVGGGPPGGKGNHAGGAPPPPARKKM